MSGSVSHSGDTAPWFQVPMHVFHMSEKEKGWEWIHTVKDMEQRKSQFHCNIPEAPDY